MRCENRTKEKIEGMAKVKVKKTASKTASKKSPAVKSPAVKKTPAGAKGVNKSKAIREYLNQHPSEGPNAVAAALKQSGVDVTPAFVSTVKSMDRKRSNGEPAQAVTPRREKELDEIGAAELLQAKKMAAELGGVDRARAALDVLAQIVG